MRLRDRVPVKSYPLHTAPQSTLLGIMSRFLRSLPVLFGLFALGLVLLACTSSSDAEDMDPAASDATIPAAVADTATFAGGCFWCMEPPYDKIDGVASTTSGFAGGEKVDPSYREVASGMTKHTEVVQVVYDSTKVSY